MGVQGKAPNGFQLPVANAVSRDKDYSPLWQTNFLKWMTIQLQEN
jgi:hypothetical protein